MKPTREYDFKMSSTPLTAQNLKSFDVVIITTDHSEVDYDLVRRNAKLIIDTRNVYKRPYPNVVTA